MFRESEPWDAAALPTRTGECLDARRARARPSPARREDTRPARSSTFPFPARGWKIGAPRRLFVRTARPTLGRFGPDVDSSRPTIADARTHRPGDPPYRRNDAAPLLASTVSSSGAKNRKNPVTAKRDTYGGSSDVQEDENLYMGVPKSELLNTPEEGLSETEASHRLTRFGYNKLREKEENIWWKLFLEFVQPMPLMIWAAIAIETLEALLKSSRGEDPSDSWIDVVVLIILQLLNVLVGFIEELKAGDAIAALRESLKPEATVKRGGRVYNMDATELVPGDIVCLGAGGAIPADCILREGKPIQVDQAALTGESLR